MKSVAVVLFILCCVTIHAQDTGELLSLVLDAVTSCVQEKSVDVVNVVVGLGKQEPSEEISCFLACLMENLFLMSADGEIQVDFVTSVVDIPIESVKKHLVNIFETCAARAEDESTKCKKAWKFAICFKENLPVLGLDVLVAMISMKKSQQGTIP